MIRSCAAILIAALWLVLAAADGWCGPILPTADGRVVDAAHILDSNDMQSLTAGLRDFEARTSVQIVVVTLPDLQGFPIEDWGLALLRDWHIGQAGKNNGVVVVIAPNDHKMRIETGYGSEGPLPDAEASLIIRRDMIPAFKQNDYAGGLEAGIQAIEAALAMDFTPNGQPSSTVSTKSVYTPPAYSRPRLLETGGSLDGKLIILFVSIPFVFMGLVIFLAVAFRGKGEQMWSSPNNTRYQDRDPFWNTRDDNSSSSGSGFSFGSSSGSSGSSDSFSGGGGSGGGGGASGQW